MERSSVIERHRKCNTLERNHVAAKDIRLLKWYEGAWSLGGKNWSTRRPGLPEGWNTRTHLRWPDRVNGRSTRSLAAVDASPARGASQDYHAGAIWRVTRMKKGGRDAMLLCGWSSSPLSVREGRGEKLSSRRREMPATVSKSKHSTTTARLRRLDQFGNGFSAPRSKVRDGVMDIKLWQWFWMILPSLVCLDYPIHAGWPCASRQGPGVSLEVIISPRSCLLQELSYDISDFTLKTTSF